jgi:hypothetical protein
MHGPRMFLRSSFSELCGDGGGTQQMERIFSADEIPHVFDDEIDFLDRALEERRHTEKRSPPSVRR